MVNINRKMYERNGIETIVDNDEILWLNEAQIKEVLDYKNLREITKNRKHRNELVKEPKKQSSRIFMNEKLAVKEITGY